MFVSTLLAVTPPLGRLASTMLPGFNLDPAPDAPPGLDAFASQLLSWLKWGVLVSGVAGLLICAVMIIIGRRNRNALATEGALGSVWVLAGLALASAAAALVGAFAL